MTSNAVDAMISVLSVTTKTEEFTSILASLEGIFKYDAINTNKLLTSASLCKLSTVLATTLTSEEGRKNHLALRMAGFLSGFVFVYMF